MNLAEFLLDLTSSDFSQDEADAKVRLQKLHSDWQESFKAKAINESVANTEHDNDSVFAEGQKQKRFFHVILALLHRSFIKSYRDIVAYGTRFIINIGLAIVMGAAWLPLPPIQSSIGRFTNAIFFGTAFMSFMAVAYVPAFIEDHATFIKERANGLYGPTAFMLANFLMGLPYLFLLALLSSSIAYFLTNLRPGASAFFTWVMWLFLDLLAGESVVVLMSSIFPNFIISLALVAFANGLWMSVWWFLALTQNSESVLEILFSLYRLREPPSLLYPLPPSTILHPLQPRTTKAS